MNKSEDADPKEIITDSDLEHCLHAVCKCCVCLLNYVQCQKQRSPITRDMAVSGVSQNNYSSNSQKNKGKTEHGRGSRQGADMRILGGEGVVTGPWSLG